MEKQLIEISLLVEQYDSPYIINYYYIQNDEIKEFNNDIEEKMSMINIQDLTYDYYLTKEERECVILKTFNCLKSAGYLVKKIFTMDNGSLANKYKVIQ